MFRSGRYDTTRHTGVRLKKIALFVNIRRVVSDVKKKRIGRRR